MFVNFVDLVQGMPAFESVTMYIIYTVYHMLYSVFQIREGSQVKNPRSLASCPDKMNGKVKKI